MLKTACSQGAERAGSCCPSLPCVCQQPPVPRKSPTRTRSWASGNGARSARLKERFTEHVRCACAGYTQREGALPVAWLAPPALLPAPVCGRAERGPPLPQHAATQEPHLELIYSLHCPSVAIRKAENAVGSFLITTFVFNQPAIKEKMSNFTANERGVVRVSSIGAVQQRELNVAVP